ncbi:MAG: metallophosphoesterase [Bacillota bacterium]
MPKNLTRRSFIKRMFGGVLVLGGISTGGYYYAHEIEPHMLDITLHDFPSPLLPQEFNGFKIVQFSDTHLGFQYNLEQFQKLIKKINGLEPDMIVFTGDLMDNPNEFKETQQIIQALTKLRAPFGKYAVYGNHDHGGYGSDIYRRIIQEAGITLLVNEARTVTLLNGSSIHIAGVDDSMLGHPNIESALSGLPENSYTILLSHAPDFASVASNYNIQLQLSGHSHGGQIQIPFWGPVVTPPHGEKYPEGFYQLGDNQGLTLYVNRGLGTTRLPFRFLSKPELTLFTLTSEGVETRDDRR